MTFRHSVLAVLFAKLLLACGGQSEQTGTAQDGAAGSSGANGGSSSGGAGGTAMACCNVYPGCPPGEQQASAAECPGQASCHQVSICCSTIWCVASDGNAGAGGTQGGSTHECNGMTCSATQACVAYRRLGGGRLTPDAGACPAHEHLDHDSCVQDFAYQCAELHGACQNQPVTCACAQPPNNGLPTCPGEFGACSDPGDLGPTVDTAAQLVCQQLVP